MYQIYQDEIRDQLNGIAWPFGTEQVYFIVEAGFSNRAADLDNCIKPLLDTYQGTFEDFNDNKVYYVKLYKTIRPKGEEFLRVRVGFIRDLPDGERTSPMGTEEQEVQIKTT